MKSNIAQCVIYVNEMRCNYYEHFPSLYNYSIEFDEKIDKYYIKNVTMKGEKELIYTYTAPPGKESDLCFHGGPGSTLEMRIFSYDALIEHLNIAGFEDITFYDPHEVIDMQKHGIFLENKCSLVLSAKKKE